MPSKIHAIALGIVALAVAVTLAFGIELLIAPRILRIAQPWFSYEGPGLVILAALLAWFREWAAGRIVWLFSAMHRLVTTVLVMAAIGAEGFMHAFSIPHLEGWWIPLLSGGAVTALGAWMRNWRATKD